MQMPPPVYLSKIEIAMLAIGSLIAAALVVLIQTC